MTELFGKLAYSMGLGASRKDALSNLAAVIGAIAGITRVLVDSGLLPANIQPYADGFLALALTMVGIVTGRTSDLTGTQNNQPLQ